MTLNFYKVYRRFVPLLLLPLIATAITGIIYSVSDRFFPLPDTVKTILISIHKGQFLGTKVVPIYVLLMGLGTFLICLIALIDNGDRLIFLHKTSHPLNIFYRSLVLIFIIPLAVCVETGIAYQLGRDWFGMSEQKINSFLIIHRGSYLGNSLSLLYTIITGLSLILLTIIGYRMVATSVVQRMKQQQKRQKTNNNKRTKSDRKILPFNEVASLRTKIQLGVIFFSLVLTGILYFGTNRIFASIVIILSIFAIPALFAAEKLIQIWQQQKKMQTQLYEKETESTTILKAIPDTLLLVSQDGTCLSYMPAKETSYFILNGDIINKNLTEFLAPEIANKFINHTQLSLQTGSNSFCCFPIYIDGKQQYHEASISPIGQTEVLIMVREIANAKNILVSTTQQEVTEKQSLQLLSESELTILLEQVLQSDREQQQNYIMLCLGIETTANNNEDYITKIILERILAYIPVYKIAQLNESELIILVKDIPLEDISGLVDEFHHSLDDFASQVNNGQSSTIFNIGLLEINPNVSDATSLIDLAKTTFKMAKQKVNLKTFW